MDAEYFPGIRSGRLTRSTGWKVRKVQTTRFFITGYEYPLGRPGQILQGMALPYLSSHGQQPYFLDFFRWRSLGRFIETYRGQWLQRLEFGYAVLVITFISAACSRCFYPCPAFLAANAEDVKPARILQASISSVSVSVLCLLKWSLSRR